MRTAMRTFYKITEKRQIRILFTLCWAAYFSTYIGRLNYSASLNEMIVSEHFSKGEAGMIGTGFFLAYGCGQFISGFLGDRLSPKKMVFTGLAVSALCNLGMTLMHSPFSMTAVWCVNGLFQAFIWSPLLRILFEYYETETRIRSCVSLNSSVPVGTVAAYALTAAGIWASGWRPVFVLASVLLAGTAVMWLLGMGRMEKYAKKYGKMEVLPGTEDEKRAKGKQTGNSVHPEQKTANGSLWKGILLSSGLVCLIPALFIQGALKDGVTTWVPTYISETYGLDGALAVVSTIVIPVFNLAGIYVASFVNLHFLKNEIRTAAAFFAVCAGALAVLLGTSGKSVVVSFLMLAVATTAMMAVNTMLIAVLPSYFGVLGRSSTVSGVLNSSVYVGGAASTYGIGALSAGVGWGGTIVVWLAAAAAAVLFCGVTVKRWMSYKRNRLGM